MMGASQNLLEIVAAAQADAKTAENRIADIFEQTGGQHGSGSQSEELHALTVSLESAAVDIFTLFEARMQHHFRRGPFSRKLKSLLLETGQADLAESVHQYYLAINVLKHGKGASYRELLNAPSALFVVRPADDIPVGEAHDAVGLVDVSVPGFFDGLTTTILEAYHFLENRQIS
ncbi:hypothetical protein [Parasedimentitalea huanghaiensis]|nr:hypothetical protein [Zongyanglinia huanghaiensis]